MQPFVEERTTRRGPHSRWVTKSVEVHSNKCTSTDLVTQTGPAIFSARKTQLYTSSMFLFRAVVALVVIGIMVAIAFLLQYLNRSKEFPDHWGNVLTLPQETTAQRIASWVVALAAVGGIYWYLTRG